MLPEVRSLYKKIWRAFDYQFSVCTCTVHEPWMVLEAYKRARQENQQNGLQTKLVKVWNGDRQWSEKMVCMLLELRSARV